MATLEDRRTNIIYELIVVGDMRGAEVVLVHEPEELNTEYGIFKQCFKKRIQIKMPKELMERAQQEYFEEYGDV